jgi:hypothetical protein
MHITAWLFPKSDISRDQLLRAIEPEEFQFISARYGVRVGMPKSLRDASVDRIQSSESEDGKLRQLGCLAYAPGELEGRPDFNRTGEPSRWWGLPSWVVSSRVEQSFKQSGLRGWAFRPVYRLKAVRRVSGSVA